MMVNLFLSQRKSNKKMMAKQKMIVTSQQKSNKKNDSQVVLQVNKSQRREK